MKLTFAMMDGDGDVFDQTPTKEVDDASLSESLVKERERLLSEKQWQAATQISVWNLFLTQIRNTIDNACNADQLLIGIAREGDKDAEACLQSGGNVRGAVRSLMDIISQCVCHRMAADIDPHILAEFESAFTIARKMHRASHPEAYSDNSEYQEAKKSKLN